LYIKFASELGQPQPNLDLGPYLDGLYGYAMVLSRNSAESEDLVQETCLRALRSIGGLRALGSVKSWLFTILRNIWLNQVRQRRTAPDLLHLTQKKTLTSPPMWPKIPHDGYVNRVEREQG
jgi:RNA polymerase sigma-70 factor (ECF subfamily)